MRRSAGQTGKQFASAYLTEEQPQACSIGRRSLTAFVQSKEEEEGSQPPVLELGAIAGRTESLIHLGSFMTSKRRLQQLHARAAAAHPGAVSLMPSMLQYYAAGVAGGEEPALASFYGSPAVPAAAPPVGGLPSATAMPKGEVWRFADLDSGEISAEMSVASLRRLAAAGEVVAETMFWSDGMPEWMPLSQCVELRRRLYGNEDGGAPTATAAGAKQLRALHSSAGAERAAWLEPLAALLDAIEHRVQPQLRQCCGLAEVDAAASLLPDQFVLGPVEACMASASAERGNTHDLP